MIRPHRKTPEALLRIPYGLIDKLDLRQVVDAPFFQVLGGIEPFSHLSALNAILLPPAHMATIGDMRKNSAHFSFSPEGWLYLFDFKICLVYPIRKPRCLQQGRR